MNLIVKPDSQTNTGYAPDLQKLKCGEFMRKEIKN
jgi:hypothetical protein